MLGSGPNQERARIANTGRARNPERSCHRLPVSLSSTVRFLPSCICVRRPEVRNRLRGLAPVSVIPVALCLGGAVGNDLPRPLADSMGP